MEQEEMWTKVCQMILNDRSMVSFFFEISLKMSLVINLFLGWCDGDINHPFKPDVDTGCEKFFSYSLAFPPKK